MKQYSWNWAKASALTLAVATLTACGGSDNNSKTGSTVDGDTGGNKVSLAEFNLMSQTGTWRFDLDMDATIDTQVEIWGQSADYLVDFVVDGSSATYVDYSNESNVVVGNCDGFPDETLNSTEFDSSFVFDDTDEEGNAMFCQTGMEQNYYIVGDDHYRIELMCDNEAIGNINLHRLSNTPEFNFGSFSLNSDMYDDLQTNAGVCGSRYFTDTNATVTSGDQVEESSFSMTAITVEAPYEDTKVLLTLNFPMSITTGTFEVINDIDDVQNDGVVIVDITSSVFGGTKNDPAYLTATMGTVTISAISEHSATGTFDIETDNNDSMEGSFSFDLGQ